MSDEEIRKLENIVKESPADVWARYRLRRNYLRAERFDEAGFQVGDLVLVEEAHSPWTRCKWDGEILRLFVSGEKYVRPIKEQGEIIWRFTPSEDYLKKGLYLTPEDKVTLIRPYLPKNDSND